MGPFSGPSVRSGPNPGRIDARQNAWESLAKQVAWEFDQGLAGRDLFRKLVLHHHVDQNPAGFFGRLLGLDDPCGLDGIAGPDRLDPPRLQPPVDRAGRTGPSLHHAVRT